MSRFKKIATKGINPSIETRDLIKYAGKTGNLYETLVVLSRRSNQLSIEMKEELHAKLEEFASSTDNLEEIHENREQIEISKFYERLPHPTIISQDELFEDQVYFRNPDKEEKEILSDPNDSVVDA